MTEKKKVLVVEDERALSKVIDLKLKSNGIDTLIAGNGLDALDLFDKKNPDLVLLDLMIPGVDGFTVLNEIRKEKKSNTPVFILSNLSQSEDRKRVEESGAQKYFVKSDTPISKIVDEIKKQLK